MVEVVHALSEGHHIHFLVLEVAAVEHGFVIHSLARVHKPVALVLTLDSYMQDIVNPDLLWIGTGRYVIICDLKALLAVEFQSILPLVSQALLSQEEWQQVVVTGLLGGRHLVLKEVVDGL